MTQKDKSIYSLYKARPVRPNIVGNPKEIRIDLVSVMCDNKYRFTFKKSELGDYKLSTDGYAYSNYSIPIRKDDLEWLADDNDWQQVFDVINKGTVAISGYRYK